MQRPQKKGFESQNEPKSEDPEKFWEPILRWNLIKNWKNRRWKNHCQTNPPKNHISAATWRVRRRKYRISIHFWMILTPQGHRFLMFFGAAVFGRFVMHFLWESWETQKHDKWLSYRKIRAILRIAKSKKHRRGCEQTSFFPVVFSLKIDQKLSQKVWKKGIDQTSEKNGVLGTTFLAKSLTLDDFGVPGASLGEALGTILRDKFRGEKRDEKKVGKVVASAGDADPGQDPPAGFFRKI